VTLTKTLAARPSSSIHESARRKGERQNGKVRSKVAALKAASDALSLLKMLPSQQIRSLNVYNGRSFIAARPFRYHD